MVCTACGGEGKCVSCRGTGLIRMVFSLQAPVAVEEEAAEATCPACDGTGDCAVCDGTGYEVGT